MNIAFYAPLKPPTAAVPSGEREIARLLMKALGAEHRVFLASRFRSFDKGGCARRQKRLAQLGKKMATRVLKRFNAAPDKRPDLWFTYHLYHKAPDWIGPYIARKLGIPYVVAEASYAPKQAGGKWARGHEAVANTLRTADLVIAFNSSDMPCVQPLVAAPERLVSLKPFLDCSAWQKITKQSSNDRQNLIKTHSIPPGTPLLLNVAMMRKGDKLASYRLLAKALIQLEHKKWHLLVAGDGPACGDVQDAFAPLAGRVSWLGECGALQLAKLYGASDLFVWPAVREAIGMCFLEAQACGLPVVGGNGGGVPDVIDDGKSGLLAAYDDVDDFALKVSALLDDKPWRERMGRHAARYAADEHDLAVTGQKLGRMLESLKP